MNDEKTLTLPRNRYETIAKILHAYALCGDEPVNLDTVAARAGMYKTRFRRTTVSWSVSVSSQTAGRKL